MSLSLDLEGMKKYYRIRPPMLLIDEAYDIVPGQSAKAIKKLSKDEWFFSGHFPQEPVMPGVLQMEAIAQTAALAIHTMPGNEDKTSYLSRIIDAKCFFKVVPGDVLYIEATLDSWKHGLGKGHGVLLVREKIACKASFVIIIEDELLKGR